MPDFYLSVSPALKMISFSACICQQAGCICVLREQAGCVWFIYDQALVALDVHPIDVFTAGIVCVVDYCRAAVIELPFHVAFPGIYVDL